MTTSSPCAWRASSSLAPTCASSGSQYVTHGSDVVIDLGIRNEQGVLHRDAGVVAGDMRETRRLGRPRRRSRRRLSRWCAAWRRRRCRSCRSSNAGACRGRARRAWAFGPAATSRCEPSIFRGVAALRRAKRRCSEARLPNRPVTLTFSRAPPRLLRRASVRTSLADQLAVVVRLSASVRLEQRSRASRGDGAPAPSPCRSARRR